MASSVTGGGDPFTGGAQQRNLAPPGVGGAIGSANTRVSAPVAGVAPTQIKSARPNEGSNIGIPYTRLVPLNNSNKLFLKNESGKMEWRTETEDLRATTLAFILGVRGKNSQGRPIVDTSTYPEAPGYAPHNVAYQPNIMPGMPGTERFQQLCSLQYLQMYFEQILSNKTIKLYEPLVGPNGVLSSLDRADSSTGPIGAFKYSEAYAAKVGVEAGITAANQGNPGLTRDNNTMLNVEDIAKKSGLKGSQAALADENFQGIFARDFGPFLKGKGSATKLVSCTVGNNQQDFGMDAATNTTNVAQPFSISRNAGDDLAFAILDAKLMEAGFTDWRPDGIVLSKGANDPSDKLSDEYLEARDGQLYNVRVQGPAIGTNWTGERSLETLPLDKVFVILVADVWFNDQDGVEQMANQPNKDAYNAKRAAALLDADENGNSRPLNTNQFEQAQAQSFAGRVQENTVLCNFRVQVSTSSQMVNHSHFSPKGNMHATQNGSKRPRLEGLSRMGLKLCREFGEYVVGGWQIGQVLDTSASRAVMPHGQLMGVRTAPNTSALNINVQIAWWTADRLARTFNNPEGTVRPRFDGRRDGPKNVVNMQATKNDFVAAVSKTTEEESE
ncbi:MAG: hypothetical protein CMD92_08005 [Gammaproteobacteria bacterium]|nr:hypothetical protein [Gammaproteobacteria bacterium]|tara:strand:- start:208 stop:2049 length:1842 start_codon:yes stop_codon:yes gene_type:complete